MVKPMQFADARLHRKYLDHIAMLNEYKSERGCVDCGYNGNPVALDLDHTEPANKIRILAHMYTYSQEKIQTELTKCVVRCANCHRIKSFEDGDCRWREVGEPEFPEWTLFSVIGEDDV